MVQHRGIHVTTPNVARIYDYWLGGKDNFAADRDAAEKILTLIPEARFAARANRAFLGRAVQFLARAGIRQFLNIGTGLPTQANVHEVAHQVNPGARVVYVDNDPVVLAHARALLNDTGATVIIEADLRDPQKILEDPGLRTLIDFGEPVAVLMVAILHFITEAEDPLAIVSRFREVMVPGSYLALSEVTAVYRQATAPMVPRSHAQVGAFFDGFELVEPGVVYAPQWRPDVGSTTLVKNAERSFMLAG